MMVVGCLLFALGMNAFIVPLNLFSSGTVGIAQIIKVVLTDYAKLQICQGNDATGIINLIINIPLMIYSYKHVKRALFFKTLSCILLMTFFLTVLSFQTILVDDMFAAVVIGGVICGLGRGLILRSDSAGSGLDMLAIVLIKKNKTHRVGKFTLYINLFIIAASTFMYNIQTAIYTGLFAYIRSYIIDKAHYQNIKTSALITSKNKEIGNCLREIFKSSITEMDANRVESGEKVFLYLIVVKKSQITKLNDCVMKLDPSAFILINDDISVLGNHYMKYPSLNP